MQRSTITGGFVALYDALRRIGGDAVIDSGLITDLVAAVSAGIVQSEPLVDLTYEEDSQADVDVNIVMTGTGKFIEIQGTAEKAPFSDAQMNQFIDLARNAIDTIISIQRKALGLTP